MTTLGVVLALLLDRVLGEPSRLHPLVGFGSVVRHVEAKLLLSEKSSVESLSNRWRGLLGCVLLVTIPAVLVAFVLSLLGGWLAFGSSVVVAYFCIGWRSLEEHAEAIREPLLRSDLPHAREQLSRIVSRDTQALDTTAIAAASIESVLENGSDAVVAPVFWFVIAGAPGVVLYRAANTLDAMWGYRTQRYSQFGWAAARLDDGLNWLPARCCAFCYALAGLTRQALGSWRAQGDKTASPNAGIVMASGAGALGVVIGGSASYNGELQERPLLGKGAAPEIQDIDAAIGLLTRSIVIVVATLALVEWLL